MSFMEIYASFIRKPGLRCSQPKMNTEYTSLPDEAVFHEKKSVPWQCTSPISHDKAETISIDAVPGEGLLLCQSRRENTAANKSVSFPRIDDTQLMFRFLRLLKCCLQKKSIPKMYTLSLLHNSFERNVQAESPQKA